jgi:hypothetical protein
LHPDDTGVNAQTALLLVLTASVITWVVWDLMRALRVRRLRGLRVITCPETGCAAAVRIDVPHAVVTSLVADQPDIRLVACSRWATRGPCEQPCVPEAQSDDSAVAAVARRAFAGRRCIYCRKPVTHVQFLDHCPALLIEDNTVPWCDVPAERLSEALRTHAVVCWNCHIAETFRRAHPELVTDRR